MYSKPAVTKFGTFRDLTKQGFKGGSDGLTFGGVDGTNCQEYLLANGATTLVCIIASPASGQR